MSNRGISMVEVMVVMFLVLVASTIMTRIPEFKKIGVKVGAVSQCSVRAEEVVDSLQSNSNKLNIVNWHPMGSDITPPVSSISGLSRLPAGVNVLPSSGAINPADVNSWSLVEANYNWLAQYYNTFSNTCLNTGVGFQVLSSNTFFSGSPFKITQGSDLKNERIYLNFQRYNLFAHTTDCVRPILMVPSNSDNIGSVAPVGIRVTATIAYDESPGVTKTCAASAIIKPDADKRAPAAMPIAEVANNQFVNPAPGACGTALPGSGQPTNCYCNNGICMSSPCLAGSPGCVQFGGVGGSVSGFDTFATQYAKRLNMNQIGGIPAVCANPGFLTESMNFAIVSSEPATIYTCSLNSAPIGSAAPPPSNQFKSCNNFSSGGTSATVTARNPVAVGTTTSAVKVDFSGLPIGIHTATLRAVDSSQNASDSSVSFAVIEPCPVSWTNSYCPGDPAPDQCWNPNVCVGTKPQVCPPQSTQACGVPIVDSCGDPCPPGNGPAPGTTDNSFVGTAAGPCGHCTVTGTCVPAPSGPPCPTSTCTGPSPAPPLCNSVGNACPQLVAVGAGGGTMTTSYNQGSGGIGYYAFEGDLSGCTNMDFVGAINPNGNGSPYGNVGISPAPNGANQITQPFAFGHAGSNFTGLGSRELAITCNGVTKNCIYTANCSSGTSCSLSSGGCR